MAEIIPAILPKDFADLEAKISLLCPATDLIRFVQIDLSDGQFTPNKTWPFSAEFDNYQSGTILGKNNLPESDKFDFEFDLMVSDPVFGVKLAVDVGASRVLPHVEALTAEDGSVSEKKFFEIEEISNHAGVELGLAIGIETPISILAPFVSRISFVQCMGILRIGFQGQSFDERVVTKIREVKKNFPVLKVVADGGVALKTAPALISAGVDRLVVGSALFRDDDIIANIQAFQNL